MLNGFSKFTTARKDLNDQFGELKVLYRQNRGEDLVAFNQSRGTKSVVLLLGREIITEFFKNESKLSSKVPLYETVDFGFIDHGGVEALTKKGIFKRFFDRDNLELLIPRIHEIVKNCFSDFEKKYLKFPKSEF